MDLGKENRMERHFEKDMNVLKERLLWMGSLAERAVHQAVHSVLESDEALAKRVLEEEDALNELQMEIDDRVVQLLALHQLMATDLRFVLAISRINNDLERIGDQAVNIAQGALRILRHPRVKPYVDLPRMSDAQRRARRRARSLVPSRAGRHLVPGTGACACAACGPARDPWGVPLRRPIEGFRV